MAIATTVTQLLGLQHPIIQAPMAGGAVPPELVARVSEAGGLGSIGAAYLAPAQIVAEAEAVRARTRRPFAVNLFCPQAPPPAADAKGALQRLAPYFAELGVEPPEPPRWTGDPFAEQFEAVLDSGAAVFSFTFGIPPESALERAKARGMKILGTATTVEEARALERAGVDAVVAQGAEAGAHRGSFAAPFEAAMVGTMALVPQVADAVRVPVIASGGIMDGRGMAAALMLGAGAVQMGTAFLTTDESLAPECHKAAIIGARAEATRVTRAFSGRPARGIVNRFMAEVDAIPDAVLPFPLQNTLTRPIRNAAAKSGRAEFLSLWAGQGAALARREGAGQLVARLVAETEAAVRRVAVGV